MNRTRRDGIMGRIVLSVAAGPLRYVIANIFYHLNRKMRMYHACQGDCIVINQGIYGASIHTQRTLPKHQGRIQLGDL